MLLYVVYIFCITSFIGNNFDFHFIFLFWAKKKFLLSLITGFTHFFVAVFTNGATGAIDSHLKKNVDLETFQF